MKRFLYRFWSSDSERKVSWIRGYINDKDKVLDLGAGPCWVTSLLRKEGFDVTPVDIKDNSIFDQIHPLVYNGIDLPYNDREFDIVLLLTVLHHAKDPISLLKEVKRVSKKVVIIEDIFTNRLQKTLIKYLDSIINMEFKDHPHNNKNDEDWKTIFEEMGFTIKDTEYHKIGGFITQSVYLLE